MKIIYRYTIEEGLTKVRMPAGAKVLFCGFQAARREASIWAEVEAGVEESTFVFVDRLFRLVGTGHQFNAEQSTYIGSFIMPDGFHTFHMYEVV